METPSRRESLDAVFAPRSVVVVGASADPSKRGHQILRRLLGDAFPGTVYAVNPRGGTILGHPVHPTLEDLPEAPDLAVVCTPGSSTPEVVEACGRKGIRGVVILAVGFRETGPAGAALERRVRAAADASGVRVVGPNTSGILNLPLGMNLIGVPGVRSGGLSLLVQSGNMALALMREASVPEGPGIAVCAGLGNEVDVGFGEALSWLGTHAGTRAVVCYTEGIRDTRAFLVAAAHLTPSTPVVLLAAGRSPEGARAARSHTGAVAGPYDRFEAGLRQAGVVPLTRTDELIPVAETLAGQPAPRGGRGVAVLSDGGGHGTLAADALSELGVPLAPLGPESRDALRSLLGPAAATGNPVDLAGAGDADLRVFPRALEILAADPAVGAVLMVGLFGGYAERFDAGLRDEELQAAAALPRLAREAGTGLVVHSLYASDGTEPLAVLRGESVPVVASLDVACRCVAELLRRGRVLEAPPWTPPAEPRGGSPSPEAVHDLPDAPVGAEVIRRVRAEGRDGLTEAEARGLLEASGVPLPPAELCATPEEAVAAAARFGGGVVLKVVSVGIPHKTEAGGVAVNRVGPEEVRQAFADVRRSAERYLESKGDDRGIQGLLVTPMQPRPLVELLVGVQRDPDLGPVLTVGAGGTWVEWIQDVGHRVLPVDRSRILDLLAEVRIGPILAGARGAPPGDREGVVEVARALAALVENVPEVLEVEINPLFVYPDRVVPVDVRVFLRSPSGDRGGAPAEGATLKPD